MGKGISYLNRNFDDYKQALIEYTKQYYPDLLDKFSDASIGNWLIDINADVADNLSYHIDRVFQETNINSAQTLGSLMAIARNNGLKIPGPKGAMAEVEFTCSIPSDSSDIGKPNWNFAPIIRAGTIVSSGEQSFEVMYDINFSKQFNSFGVSDRTIKPKRNNSGIIGYDVSKLGIVVAGESKIFSKVLRPSDIKPFLEILIPSKNVMSVESVIVKDGTDFFSQPEYGEFFSDNVTSNNIAKKRFYEVNNLSQQTVWGDAIDNGKTEEYNYRIDGKNIPAYSIVKGAWLKINHKFITEYTDSGYLKLIFGSGLEPRENEEPLGKSSTFAINQMEKILNNSSLGFLPQANSTLYVLYRVGGGRISNVPKGAISYIKDLKCGFNPSLSDNSGNYQAIKNIKNSIQVVNTTPSVSGKDKPTIEELRYYIKYNNASQERCVTLKDYKYRILSMPSRYGTPFRVGVIEENNKVMVYILGIDHRGKLSEEMPDMLLQNIETYLSRYRMINDFVEIKAGKIINVSFELKLHIDKAFNPNSIRDAVSKTIIEYMDINKREMGDDIFIGDMLKEILKNKGVINVAYIKAFDMSNKDGYSVTEIPQAIKPVSEDSGENVREIDLESSENILYSEADAMIELKEPEKDIILNIISL